MKKMIGKCLALSAVLFVFESAADEFKKGDLERCQKEYDAAVTRGRKLWVSGTKLGTNGVSCAQCHPNAANTHPETYPKFQKQIGRMATYRATR